MILVVIFASVCCYRIAAAQDARSPNVVLILTDDQGWGDLGAHGNSIVNTPALDRLASQSVRFENFFVSPVCAPTRAALLTGRYPERTGVTGVTGRREVMHAEETTIAEVLKSAGYKTGCFGKWHNGAQLPLHPNGQGFDEFFGFCGGHFNLYDDAILEHNGRPVQTKGYITDVLTDHAIQFIQDNSQQRFFCYVPLNAPHGPFQVNKKLFDKYNTGQIDEKTAAVYAMVENIDHNVDRVLKTLDQEGLAENTILVFLTDNGPNGKRFNGGMRGAKGSVHEGGCKVPCFIRWPDKLQPQVVHQISAHIDLLPTLVEWCSISLPFNHQANKPLDGQSLASLVEHKTDRSDSNRKIITLRFGTKHQTSDAWPGRYAVRSQRYRLVSETPNEVQLYDMSDDPGQKVDIADQNAETVQRLRKVALEYFAEVGPSLNQSKPIPISPNRPTFLPSVDAEMSGKPGFADGIEWAHSWVDQWSDEDDRIRFRIDVEQPGRYIVQMHYACSGKDTGVTLHVADQTLATQLKRAPNKSVIRPDLDSKSIPRRMLDFATQTFGACELPAGQTTIELARRVTGDAMIEFGGLTLTKCDLPDKENLHLFVLAGQSNMAGRGNVTAADRYPDNQIIMLDQQQRWVPAIDPVHFDKSVAGVGLGREFARQYIKAHPGVTVGLIPCAAGGSPISSWVPEGYHSQTKSHPYDDCISRIDIAQQVGVVKGVLWHQGESDCKPGAAEAYHDRLIELFTRFRAVVGNATPILIGGLARNDIDSWSEHRKLVDRAHQGVAKELQHAAFVDSAGLKLKSDNVHFDRESLFEFGRRYASAFQSLTSH